MSKSTKGSFDPSHPVVVGENIATVVTVLILVAFIFLAGASWGQDRIRHLWGPPSYEEAYANSGPQQHELKRVVIDVPLGETVEVPGTNFKIKTWMPKGGVHLYRLRAQIIRQRPLVKIVNPNEPLTGPFDDFTEELGNNFRDEEADCPLVMIDQRYLFHVESMYGQTYNEETKWFDKDMVVQVVMYDLGTNTYFNYH